MSEEQLSADEKADRVINGMIAAVIGTSVIPTYVNWSATATAMGAGVIGIGLCYGVELSRDEAWHLVKQFFSAASCWFLGMVVGSRILSAIMTATGFGYFGAVALDATVSAALAYAIGSCSKAYFKGMKNKEQLGRLFREQFNKAKQDLANQ